MDLLLPAPGVAVRGPRQANNGHGANADDPDDDGVAGEVAAAAEITIRVSGTSLGRMMGVGLIIPRIPSLVEAVLVVQAFGAVVQVPWRAPAFAGRRTRWAARADYRDGCTAWEGPRAVLRGTTLGEMALLKKLGGLCRD